LMVGDVLFVEPYIDVLVFFYHWWWPHVGRNAFGLWPIKVFKSSWFLLHFSIQTARYEEHPVQAGNVFKTVICVCKATCQVGSEYLHVPYVTP
jgi:hypothetical protein